MPELPKPSRPVGTDAASGEAAGEGRAKPRPRSRAAQLASGLLLSAATLLAMGVGFEILFPRILTALPLNLQPHVPKPFGILCQSSKAGTLPRDWIALFGDSYAQGSGDWLTGADPWRNPPFHSAHLIREALGADVVSFGAGGAGSVDGLVKVPLTALAALRARFDIADPRLILAYFYEGNDLEDNMGRLRREKGLLRDGRLDAEAFDEFLGRSLRSDPDTAPSGAFLATRFTIELVRNIEARLRGRESEEPQRSPPEYGVYNKAAVGGVEVDLPRYLQGPALGLLDPETDLAIEVFEQSLRFLRSRLRAPLITVVYVPSVLSCYDLRGTVSPRASRRRLALYPAERVRERSDQVAARVAAAAARSGAGFIDTREAVRAAATRAVLHGPRDWKHFNRRGYEAFSAAVVAGLREEPAHESVR